MSGCHLVVPAGLRGAYDHLLMPVIDADGRLRGPYTAGGAIVRSIVPQADPELVAAHDLEIRAVAPELCDTVPARRETLYNRTPLAERTRIHSRFRTARIAHGLIDFLHAHLAGRATTSAPAFLAIDDVHRADPTDRELIALLLRRSDPAVLPIVVGTAVGIPEFAGYAEMLAGEPAPEPVDLLDPAAHDARADELTAGDWSWRLGAIPYHRERGTDPEAAVHALRTAIDHCYAHAFHHACVDLGRRGRARTQPGSAAWWEFTRRMAGSLTLLGQGRQAEELYDEACAASAAPAVHREAAYSKAMLYARHLDPQQHDQVRALHYINRALAFAGQIPDRHDRMFLGVFYRNGEALIRMRRGDHDHALALVTAGLADLPPDQHRIDRCSLLSNRARLLAALGRTDEAVAAYDDLLAVDPDYAEYHFDRANLLYGLDRHAEARASYDTAVRLGPPFPELHYNRAVLLRAEADLEGALRDLNRVLDLDPQFLDAYVDRAELREMAEDTAGAEADVRAGLDLDPGNRHLTCLRGRLAAAAGDFAGARADFDAAIAADPGLAAAWADRAALSYDQGDPAAAVADLTRALDLGENPALLFNRAVALNAAGHSGQARADLLRTLDLTPCDPDARRLLAELPA